MIPPPPPFLWHLARAVMADFRDAVRSDPWLVFLFGVFAGAGFTAIVALGFVAWRVL